MAWYNFKVAAMGLRRALLNQGDGGGGPTLRFYLEWYTAGKNATHSRHIIYFVHPRVDTVPHFNRVDK